MPRFYFDLSYDEGPWSDATDGVDLASRENARTEAVTVAAEIAREQVRHHHQIAVRVRDDGPEPVVTVTLSVAVMPPD